jgi:hypothetical protein
VLCSFCFEVKWFRRKIFSTKSFFSENIFSPFGSYEKITGEEFPSLTDKIPMMKVRIWSVSLESGTVSSDSGDDQLLEHEGRLHRFKKG